MAHKYANVNIKESHQVRIPKDRWLKLKYSLHMAKEVGTSGKFGRRRNEF
jgi:hypothetical protein